MPNYEYTAIDKNGIVIKERIQEKSREELIKRLKTNELTPIQIVQKGVVNSKDIRARRVHKIVNVSSEDSIMKLLQNREDYDKIIKKEKRATQGKKIEVRDLIIFTDDFYLLKRAGFNNVHALETIVKSTENPTLVGIIEDILAGLEAGDYMYTTMEYYSEFPPIYVNLIKVGELSGALEESLNQASEYLSKSSSLKKKIKEIIIPNVVQFIALLILMIIGSMIVVPVIQGVFEKVGSTEKLPWITMEFSKFLNSAQKHWYIPLIIIASIFLYFFSMVQTPKGKYKFDLYKYRAPVFGPLVFAIDLQRFINAMLLNLQNGMRIQDALDVSKNVVKNLVFLSIIETSLNNIISGENWVKPFEDSGLCAPMVTEMLKVGMQTDLTMMMGKLLEFVNMDIDVIIGKIIKILPQIMYVVIGSMIIFITVVVLVPCIQVYMGSFLFSAAGF